MSFISYAVYYDIHENQEYNKAENLPAYEPFEAMEKYWKQLGSPVYTLQESSYCGAFFLGIL